MAALSVGKYIFSMGRALAFTTRRRSGQRTSTASIMAAWSGSMWSTIR